MKYTSKPELIGDAEKEFAALREMLAAVPEGRYREPGVWGDDWTVHDLVAHLSAWHRLFLGWYRAGLEGLDPDLPASGFKWNETPRLNRHIREEHADRPTPRVRRELEETHAEVVELARGLSENELLEPGHFAWTGTNGIVTYLGANTASHYRFARKVLKRWRTGVGIADD